MTHFCCYLTSEPLNAEPLNQVLFKEPSCTGIYRKIFELFRWDTILVGGCGFVMKVLFDDDIGSAGQICVNGAAQENLLAVCSFGDLVFDF